MRSRLIDTVWAHQHFGMGALIFVATDADDPGVYYVGQTVVADIKEDSRTISVKFLDDDEGQVSLVRSVFISVHPKAVRILSVEEVVMVKFGESYYLARIVALLPNEEATVSYSDG